MKRKLIVFTAVAAASLACILGCWESNDTPSDVLQNQATKAALAFWNANIEGDYNACWTNFSPEFLESMRVRFPSLFRNKEAYIAQRRRFAKEESLATASVKRTHPGEQPKSVSVTIELSRINQHYPVLVRQLWKKEKDRWVLMPGS